MSMKTEPMRLDLALGKNQGTAATAKGVVDKQRQVEASRGLLTSTHAEVRLPTGNVWVSCALYVYVYVCVCVRV